MEASSIRAVIPCRGGGQVVMLGLPGLAVDIRGGAWVDPDEFGRALEELKRLDVALFFLFARDEEAPAGLRHTLRSRLKAQGVRFAALPIGDFCAPSPAWMSAWRRAGTAIEGALDSGCSVALCCSYGAGRSGTVAAYILNQRGQLLDDALATVRDGFAEAVESPAQEQWLRSMAGENFVRADIRGGRAG